VGSSEGEEALGGDGKGEPFAVEMQLDLVEDPGSDRRAPAEVLAAEEIYSWAQRSTPVLMEPLKATAQVSGS